jgi:hypothetical protein
MINLAHEEALPFLAPLAFGNVVSDTDNAREPSLALVVLEVRKPTHLYPADFAVSSLNPVLVGG